MIYNSDVAKSGAPENLKKSFRSIINRSGEPPVIGCRNL